ncbi:hypothetical protein PM082_022660 [Marasmius tenuissimus]|nr:hypothetical protein PM082_022660 [Marasmius tenuissimus]
MSKKIAIANGPSGLGEQTLQTQHILALPLDGAESQTGQTTHDEHRIQPDVKVEDEESRRIPPKVEAKIESSKAYDDTLPNSASNSERWHEGNPGTTNSAPAIPKPPLEKSWEVIMKEVNSLDEGLIGGWKEDIDTLLVFAGLFSAVVTAFTVESYQWLDEAPEDATVALLKQIFQKMANETVLPSPPFRVSPSVVRINVLWFSSLMIALVDALFALLCKQWLREHRRHTHTRTPQEALALNWLRSQSLKKWHVPTILAFLPVLLEIALFLFLAGLIELLRARHQVPFAIAVTVIAFAGTFYLGTTIIPAVDIIRQALQIPPELARIRAWKAPRGIDIIGSSPVDFIMNLPPMEYVCPYKSPQAWAAFKVLQAISRFPPLYILLSSICTCWDCSDPWVLHHTYVQTTDSLSGWYSVDLEALQRSDICLAPNFYELNAFRWIVAELRDTPIMIPHLLNILEGIPPHLVMPAVLDQWFFHPTREWTISDIGELLQSGLSFLDPEDRRLHSQQSFMKYRTDPELINQILHWTHVFMNVGQIAPMHHRKLAKLMAELIERTFPAKFGFYGLPFALHRIDLLLADPKTHDLGSTLWSLCGDTRTIGHDQQSQRYSFACYSYELAQHIIASSPGYTFHMPTATTTSLFVQSQPGVKFICDIHEAALNLGLCLENWMHAMDIVRRVHHLPEDHFETLRGVFPLPLQQLKNELSCRNRGGSRVDFGYLTTYRDHWDNANACNKMKLVLILSNEINISPSQVVAESNNPLDETSEIFSPLVGSTVGLDLITFVNNRLVEEKETYASCDDCTRLEWDKAINYVRSAHQDLSANHFKPILHDGAPIHNHPPLIAAPEVVSTGRANSIDLCGTLDRSSNAMVPVLSSGQSSGAEVYHGSSPVKDKNNDIAEAEVSAKASDTVGHPAQGQPSDVARFMGVGGPDADRNV